MEWDETWKHKSEYQEVRKIACVQVLRREWEYRKNCVNEKRNENKKERKITKRRTGIKQRENEKEIWNCEMSGMRKT